MADYSEAILRDSSLVPAYVNRGLALLELKQYAAALADFETAATPDQHDPSIEAGRGMALEGLGRGQEADTAFQSALSHAATLDESVRTRLLWTYGFAVAGRLPDNARKAFETVSEPSHPAAGSLWLCGSQWVGTIVPTPWGTSTEPWRRIPISARLGSIGPFSWPVSGSGLERAGDQSLPGARCGFGMACYCRLLRRIACIEGSGDPAAADQAVTFLEKARARGADLAKAATDRPGTAPVPPRVQKPLRLKISHDACRQGQGEGGRSA